jgi:hypothetical protein
VSDFELIPFGQFSQYFVPPVFYQVHQEKLAVCFTRQFLLKGRSGEDSKPD